MNRFDRNLELVDGLETEYLRIMYYDFDKYYKDEYKSYEYNRLCTIIDGEKKVEVNNGKSFTYSKGQFILLSPNSTINIEIVKPTTAMVLEISDKLIDNVNKKTSCNIENKICKDNNQDQIPIIENYKLNHIMHKIMNTANSKDNNKEFLIDLYAQEMTYNLLEENLFNNFSADIYDNDIQNAINLMKNNIFNNINVSCIALALNMSLTSFSTKFKKETGVNPNTYFTNLKLLKAKELLKYKSVTEVAYTLGYDNISHFIHLFKTRFGITPKQYSLKTINHN